MCCKNLHRNLQTGEIGLKVYKSKLHYLLHLYYLAELFSYLYLEFFLVKTFFLSTHNLICIFNENYHYRIKLCADFFFPSKYFH